MHSDKQGRQQRTREGVRGVARHVQARDLGSDIVEASRRQRLRIWPRQALLLCATHERK